MNQLLIRTLNKFKLLHFINVCGIIQLNKKKFKIPILQKTGLQNLLPSELWMIDLLEIVLKVSSKGFIDVGVNIGQTLLKLKSILPEIQYIGFEPNSQCVCYTDKLITKNNLANCQLIPVGISTSSDIRVLNFMTDSISDSTASIIENFRPNNKIYRRAFIALFSIEQIKKKINLSVFSILKIDVEGAELEVIKSFYSTIENNKPIILIEILPAYNEQNKFRIKRQEEIQQILYGLNYTFFSVRKENENLIDIVEINKIEIHSDLNNCEYVVVHNSKKDDFKNCCQDFFLDSGQSTFTHVK